jgi:hypothetical protein
MADENLPIKARLLRAFVTFPPVLFIWRLLPPRCQYFDCERKYLRYTEDLLFAGTPDNPQQQRYWICQDCVHKIRREAFKQGFSREDVGEGVVKYTPPSKSEGSE